MPCDGFFRAQDDKSTYTGRLLLLVARLACAPPRRSGTPVPHRLRATTLLLRAGVYANGGPTNVDTVNAMAAGEIANAMLAPLASSAATAQTLLSSLRHPIAGNLAIQMDRSSADVRGVKHTHK